VLLLIVRVHQRAPVRHSLASMGKGGSQSSIDPLGGTTDLWAMMGMKKFSVLDVTDGKAEEPTTAAASPGEPHALEAASPNLIMLQCTAASDRQVVVSLRIRSH